MYVFLFILFVYTECLHTDMYARTHTRTHTLTHTHTGVTARGKETGDSMKRYIHRSSFNSLVRLLSCKRCVLSLLPSVSHSLALHAR